MPEGLQEPARPDLAATLGVRFATEFEPCILDLLDAVERFAHTFDTASHQLIAVIDRMEDVARELETLGPAQRKLGRPRKHHGPRNIHR